MNYNFEIKRALEIEIGTLLAATYPTSWPNRPFNEPNAATWLKFNILTTPPIEQTLSATDRVNGLVQIDVMMPKSQGDQDAYDIADILTTSLPKNGDKLTNGATDVFIRTISQPRNAQDPNWHRMIIEISFYSFVPRV